MFTLKIENSRNEVIELTHNEGEYQVVRVEGLNPPPASINTSVIAGLDGTRYNSSRLNERDIVITLRLNGDVEENRLKLYNFFNTKNYCKVYYKNGKRDVFIEGYVETTEVDHFALGELMQVSIICPNPYFKSAQMIIDDISKIISLFEFEFAIDIDDPIEFSNINNSKVTNVVNNSESDNGIIIEIEVMGSINKIQIRNVDSGEQYTVRHALIENDLVVIDTNKGSKSINLIRNGLTYNIFTSMEKGSDFFQLRVGDNFFSYLIDDGANDERVHILFKHYNTYRGV